MYTGLNPLDLLNYPAEDVFELIKGVMDYGKRNNSEGKTTSDGNKVIRRPAGDNWF